MKFTSHLPPKLLIDWLSRYRGGDVTPQIVTIQFPFFDAPGLQLALQILSLCQLTAPIPAPDHTVRSKHTIKALIIIPRLMLLTSGHQRPKELQVRTLGHWWLPFRDLLVARLPPNQETHDFF